jgi:hypothetical protein
LSRNAAFSVFLYISLVFLALAILCGMVWGNIFHSHNFTGEKDFFVPWLAARTFLDYGDSPYSESASQRAQVVHYGRLASDTEDPLILWVPFPAELIYFPFALLQDYNIAHGLWMTLSEIALVAAAFLSLRLVEWNVSRYFLSVVLLFPILWSFGLLDLLASGPLPFVLLALIGALLYLRSGQDEVAGILLLFPLLMIGTFTMCGVFLVWWALYHHRWRAFAGLGMVLGILLLLSFLLLPDWIMPFARGLYWHISYNPGLSTFRVLGSIWPVVGPRLSWLLTATVLILFLVEWRGTRQRDFRHVLWTTCLTLSAAPLLGLPVNLHSIAILILPLFLFLAILGERWPGRRLEGPAGVGFVFVLSASWGVVLTADVRLSFLLPVLLVAGLYWMKWWAVRPPRTVLESMQ